MTRSELYKQFNFSERICHIYDLEKTKESLLEKLQQLDQEITERKSELPENIIKEYEAFQIIDRLKGTNEISKTYE